MIYCSVDRKASSQRILQAPSQTSILHSDKLASFCAIENDRAFKQRLGGWFLIELLFETSDIPVVVAERQANVVFNASYFFLVVHKRITVS